VALAKEGGSGGGGVNIQAGDCSQIQIIFIQQFLDEDKDKNKDEGKDDDDDKDRDEDKDKDGVATTTGETRAPRAPRRRQPRYLGSSASARSESMRRPPRYPGGAVASARIRCCSV
jgi:hypothetical protein